jgi:P4 family phage/plasmid primase-like protien
VTTTTTSAMAIPDIDPEADTLTGALAYAGAGLYVGPIRTDDSKHAGNILGNDWPSKTSRDSKTIISWFAGRNLGVFIHVGRSGLWVADVDDPDRLPAVLATAIADLRPPFQSSRPDQRGRGHAVFATPPGRTLGNSIKGLGKGWGEARGKNGIIVAAPTPRNDGGRYRWLRTGPAPVLPSSVADLLPEAGPGAGAVDDAALSAFLTTHTRADRPTLLKAVTNAFMADVEANGSRHDAARDASCWAMREAACGFYPAHDAAVAVRDLYIAARSQDRDNGRDGVDTGTARAEYRSILAWAIAQVDLDDLEQRRNGVNSRTSDQHQELALADGHRATDVGNADRLAALADGHIRYVHAWSKWIVYTDGVWQIDTSDALITELAKVVARKMFRQAAALAGDQRDAMWKWAKRSETTPSIRAMIHLTRGISGILVDHTALDQRPWLLNVANGTIDLRTARLLDHDPEHLLTKVIPLTYDAHAAAPQFEKFLERIMPDRNVRSYLHRFVGYSATGLIREHVFPIWWGDGSNGKSTLIGLIRQALGDYAISAARDLFMASKYESHDTKYADLFGRRLATRTETRDGGNLDEARVKELTGGDPMKGRRMREDYWEFEPSHKLVLATNHKPRIEGTDHAIWRRVHLVPFTEKIVEPELDPELPEKLQAELPGVLAWIVRGCAEWQKHGLKVPSKVQAATAAYKGESDLTARFLDECGIELRPDDPAAWERSSVLTEMHRKWCDDNGLDHNRQWQTTTGRLKELGAKSDPRKRVRGWAGLKAPGPEPSATGVYGGPA